MLTYALKLADRYDGMVLATFPDVPEALAMGRDCEEAMEQAQGALEAALERYVSEGLELPTPRAGGRITVSTVKFEALTPA
ncbi:MAG TPA: type II toxin-antitoxin system HicB family antitoxin [Allosphingosinicella sp.]|nr:type II toxin-antitoxin system HicB family antitoxin [Allosphingosinicella sp.]